MGQAAVTRYSVGERRMARILEIAREMFAERGYHETTLRAVAAEAGITDAGVMHYFPTKSHLLAAVAREKGERAAEAWGGLSEPSLHVILAMMWTTTRTAQLDPVHVEISVAAAAEGSNPNSPTHADYASAIQTATRNTAQLFEECIQRGEILADTDPMVLARACLAIGNGLNTQWVLAERDFDMSEYLLVSLAQLGSAVSTDPDGVEEMVAKIRAAAAQLAHTPPA